MKSIVAISAILSVLVITPAVADDPVGDDNDQLTSDAQVDLSPEAYVCFFEHADYEGKKTCYTQDWYDAAKPARRETSVAQSVDNTFSSVKVGKAVAARGCQNRGEYSYYCKRFVGDINYLGDDWNDVISSITVDKFFAVWPTPVAREPDFTDAYSLDDENHLSNAKESPDSMRPSICLYSETNYGGEEKCFHGEGPLDTEQGGWAEKAASFRIGLGYTLCRPQKPAEPRPEGQDYDTATTGCEPVFSGRRTYASYRKIPTYQGNFRGFTIKQNEKYERYM